jgi:hypothetical protein
MDDTIMVFSGRAFCSEDIKLIKWVIKTYPKLPVTELACIICELLDWTTLSGRAKKQQCIAFLDQLESEGIIKLPSRVVRNKAQRSIQEIDFDTTEISGDINCFDPIRLVIARPGDDLNRWQSYVNQYHM